MAKIVFWQKHLSVTPPRHLPFKTSTCFPTSVENLCSHLSKANICIKYWHENASTCLYDFAFQTLLDAFESENSLEMMIIFFPWRGTPLSNRWKPQKQFFFKNIYPWFWFKFADGSEFPLSSGTGRVCLRLRKYWVSGNSVAPLSSQSRWKW